MPAALNCGLLFVSMLIRYSSTHVSIMDSLVRVLFLKRDLLRVPKVIKFKYPLETFYEVNGCTCSHIAAAPSLLMTSSNQSITALMSANYFVNIMMWAHSSVVGNVSSPVCPS